MAASARDLQIGAFPPGEDLWRIDWFGGVAFPDRLLRRTQPSVFVHLSKIIDPQVIADPMRPVAPSSTLPVARQAKRWVSVGSTTLLSVGDVWSGKRFVCSPDHEVETFENLQINRSTTQLLKAGHSDEQGRFLLPISEHPWHLGNTHSYCVRVALPDGRSLVVPCMELALFYFGSSSELLSRLFGPFDVAKLYSKATLDLFGEHIDLDLADGMRKESAHDVARIATSDRARQAAGAIGTSLLKQRQEGVDPYPQCFFPFDGETTLIASGKWLPLGTEPRATFLVYRVRSCAHPFPFNTLRVRESGVTRRAKVTPHAESALNSQRPRRGARDARDATVRERDGSGKLAPRARSFFREYRFPDLLKKRIWSEAKLEPQAASASLGAAPPVADVAVGTPGSTDRVRPIALVEAMRQSFAVPEFLLSVIERLARAKRVTATLLTASVEDGWTVPMPFQPDENGEISHDLFVGAGTDQRIRRLAIFALVAGSREATIAVIEFALDRPEILRLRGSQSVNDVLKVIGGDTASR